MVGKGGRSKGARMVIVDTQGTRQAGFSLLELLITIGIAGILLGLAVPSFSSFLNDSKVSAATNDLVYALQTARSESIKRSSAVVLCPSTNPTAADPSCGGGYGNGWVVFADDDSNGTRNDGEEIILQVDAQPNGFSITPDTAFANRIFFGDTGSSTNPTGVPLSGQIEITYAGSGEARDVFIAANGRISSQAQ